MGDEYMTLKSLREPNSEGYAMAAPSRLQRDPD